MVMDIMAMVMILCNDSDDGDCNDFSGNYGDGDGHDVNSEKGDGGHDDDNNNGEGGDR